MTEAAVGDKALCLVECVVDILSLIHCKDGRKLLMGEFFAELNALDLADKDLGMLGNGYVRKLSDFECGLADYFALRAPLIRMVFLTFSVSSGFRK